MSARRALQLTCLGAAWMAHGAAGAQIVTDTSLGQVSRTLNGPSFQIPQALGKLAGNNLFHSFRSFNLLTGDSANFTTSTPGIANVISRVTGGAPSTLNGALTLTAASGAPAFFFINPAGVTFGAGASVDVPGAFHVSTADALHFADGALHADLSRTSTFSSAAPEAFGFLGATRAAIAIRNGALVEPGLGAPMTLAAGDILIDGARARAFGGDLNVAAVGAASVLLPLGAPPAALEGSVVLLNDAILGVSNWISLDAGRLSVSAGTIDVVYSSVVGLSLPDSSGKGGSIDLAASTLLTVDDESIVSTSGSGSGQGGAITLRAGDIAVLGRAAISSEPGGSGAGGDISMHADGMVYLDNAFITSLATASGQGGAIAIRAQDLAVTGKGRITSQNEAGGNGGAIVIDAQNISLSEDARITSQTYGNGMGGALYLAAAGSLALSNATISADAFATGAAGAVNVAAGAIDLSDKSQLVSVAQGSGATGMISIVTPGLLSLNDGSTIAHLAEGQGSATALQVSAGNIFVTGGSEFLSTGIGVLGHAGDIDIKTSGTFSLSDVGRIQSYGRSGGSAGNIAVAAKSIIIEGSNDPDNNSTIFSGSDDGTGAARSITLSALETIAIIKDGAVASSAHTNVDAGNITLSARDIILDEGRINSSAINGSGNGGAIDITARGALTMHNRSAIAGVSASPGEAGTVRITAADMTMADDSLVTVSSFGRDAGKAGTVDIKVAGKLSMTGMSDIDSSSLSLSDAGAITIAAGEVLIDSGGIRSATLGAGNAGTIDISVARAMVLSKDGRVVTNTTASGDAGAIRIRASALQLNNGSIQSQAEEATGNAGSIDVLVTGDLNVTSGGFSSSSTGGSAGSVQLFANNVSVSGPNSSVTAVATTGSMGQTGSIDIMGGESIRLSDGAVVSINNFAQLANPAAVQPTQIRLAAPSIVMDNARIAASAFGNVAASSISIHSTDRLLLTNSGIFTSANDGDGGAIAINGGKLVVLNNSLLTTSVFGVTGDGGDIRVNTDALVLNTGFIQANTAAADASGGLVNINAKSLVTSGSTLFAGGDTPLQPLSVFGLNVIQAAAPTGISGTIAITNPVLDVSGSLRGLNAQPIDSGGLGRDPCQASGGSSLVQAGRGGLPASARGMLGAPAATTMALAALPQLALLERGGCR
jgi:filamentous hemagglutinin family protein